VFGEPGEFSGVGVEPPDFAWDGDDEFVAAVAGRDD
jgi:hypothetical protein